MIRGKVHVITSLPRSVQQRFGIVALAIIVAGGLLYWIITVLDNHFGEYQYVQACSSMTSGWSISQHSTQLAVIVVMAVVALAGYGAKLANQLHSIGLGLFIVTGTAPPLFLIGSPFFRPHVIQQACWHL